MLCNPFWYSTALFSYFSTSLPSESVLIVQQRRIQRFLTEYVHHIFAESVPHFFSGNGTRIHNVMGHPDEMYAALTGLVLKKAVQAAHVAAGHMVIHDDYVHIESFAHLPQLIQQVHIAAVGVGAHHHALVAAGQILHGLLLVADGDEHTAARPLHLPESGSLSQSLSRLGYGSSPAYMVSRITR